MAVLRVVGVDTDHLLLVDPDGGGHRVAIDTALRDTLKQAATVGRSRLTPREIQDRLRSGASTEQVAEAAGVSAERIRRWEGPILAERERAVDAAQKVRYARPHDGAVSGPLGRLVTGHLDHHGLVGEWDAYRDPEGVWVVVVRHERGEAAWRHEHGTLTALDPHAESFGWREPPRAVANPRAASGSTSETPPRESGRRGRASIPSWESIMENAPPPTAFPT